MSSLTPTYNPNSSGCETVDETTVDYIITQVFGWATGILALVKIFFFTITFLSKRYAKNVSMAFVIIGIIGAICAIIFGVRINEISIYVRGIIMLILSIIIFVAKIVFDIEHDRKIKEINLKPLCNVDEITKKLESILENNTGDWEEIIYRKDDVELIFRPDKIIINSIELTFSNEIIMNLVKFMYRNEMNNKV